MKPVDIGQKKVNPKMKDIKEELGDKVSGALINEEAGRRSRGSTSEVKDALKEALNEKTQDTETQEEV